jgi:sugar/nucleoside kinase (ribokinase family)
VSWPAYTPRMSIGRTAGGPTVLAVGDLMLDVRAASGSLARGGDVHGRVLVQPGGTSANAAVWAVSAGARATVVGAVGDDVPGRLLREALEARGVHAAVVAVPDVPTGTMLVIHEAGDRSMVADRGANARLMPSDLPADPAVGALLVSGYLLLQEPTTETAVEALGGTHTGLAAVDTASWPLLEAFGVDRFFRETTSATVVLTNELEAKVLTGRDGEDACGELGDRFRIAAVKLGARGAVLSIDGERSTCRAEPVREVDPTGAGDAFDGVLLTSLAAGVDPGDALQRACHAGALVAASESAWPAEAP